MLTIEQRLELRTLIIRKISRADRSPGRPLNDAGVIVTNPDNACEKMTPAQHEIEEL
jgi:hypothetical protein